ncbi:MAG: hypothetical protein LBG71_03730 [Clostridiales Family XIII bacterium]|jgi:hypothetical protein|nr:hypothetical protein [Clostridiales Family XIII bacterium]
MKRRCYVKFCGGCNPNYDRGAFCAVFRELYQGKMEILAADTDGQGRDCDFLLYIAGCARRCTDLGAWRGPGRDGRVITVWDGAAGEEAFAAIDAALGAVGDGG